MLGEEIRLSRKSSLIGEQLKATGVEPTFRKIGRAMNVSPSTELRWFEPEEVEREVDFWAGHFDEDGSFKGLTGKDNLLRTN
ncbi:hypothetical protein [Pararhizobium sp. IMCC21322]|uniref:hypothetical protein n=1 Tax=Pararhizobium sp. IMCC21322 TaxID=3067903 RepID=UPI002740CBC4|nr:hypothetical protein [Pararhizobium sp. IMCC21322]